MGWIYVAQNRILWWNLVKTILTFQNKLELHEIQGSSNPAISF
jgi:hypothetical protein